MENFDDLIKQHEEEREQLRQEEARFIKNATILLATIFVILIALRWYIHVHYPEITTADLMSH